MDSALPLDLIKRFGTAAVIRRETRTASDSSKPWRDDSLATTTDYPCWVVFDQRVTHSTDGIVQKYEVAYIPSKDLAIKPKMKDVIISNGTRSVIQTVTEYSPDNIELLYELRITR